MTDEQWIASHWIGKRVKQTAVSDPEYARNIGRESTVLEAFVDEKGHMHVRTEDGMWCPVSLLSIIQACGNYQRMGCDTDQDGKRVNPESCYVCGCSEKQHARKA